LFGEMEAELDALNVFRDKPTGEAGWAGTAAIPWAETFAI
jgi:hypothetical protein